MAITKNNTTYKFAITLFLLFITVSLSHGQSKSGNRLKTSLNAYSFHRSLTKDSMDLESLIQFTAAEGFEGIDLTGYYFKGYPEVPSDSTIYSIKRLAFGLGLEISGTGIRTDFTHTETTARRENIELIKKWIVVASKLDAPVLRIFAGKAVDNSLEREKVLVNLISDLSECIEFAASFGVILGLQNHNAFLKNADQVIEIMDQLPTPWLGVVLDIGSYREGNPYEQIQRTIPYAVNWQLKEKMYENGFEITTNLDFVIEMIKNSSYQGYIPIETLGPGNSKTKVHKMIKEVDEILKINN